MSDKPRQINIIKRSRVAWEKARPQQRVSGRPLQRRNRRIKLRDGYRCQNTLCGIVAREAALVVDHIVPVAFGGSDDDSNLQALCIPCNNAKAEVEATGRQVPDPHRFAPVHPGRMSDVQDIMKAYGPGGDWKNLSNK